MLGTWIMELLGGGWGRDEIGRLVWRLNLSKMPLALLRAREVVAIRKPAALEAGDWAWEVALLDRRLVRLSVVKFLFQVAAGRELAATLR